MFIGLVRWGFVWLRWLLYLSNLFSRTTVKITADRKRGRPPKEVQWTTKTPGTRRRGPEDIMTKGQSLSAEAKAAKNIADLWSLFITPQMVANITRWTNQKIQEDMDQHQYTREKLRKCPYLKHTDEVKCFALLPALFYSVAYSKLPYMIKVVL